MRHELLQEHTTSYPFVPPPEGVITWVSSRFPFTPMRPTTASTRTSLGRKAGQIHDGAHGNGNARSRPKHPGPDQSPRTRPYPTPRARCWFQSRPLAGRLEAIVRDLQIGLVRRLVQLRHVLTHHPLGVELRAEMHQRLLDAPHPLHRARRPRGPDSTSARFRFPAWSRWRAAWISSWSSE